MAAYKLTYFPCRARGELIRLIFVQAGVEYENIRLGFFPFGSSEWTEMKKTIPTVGQTLPILEVNGKTLSGSQLCIARYLAEKFGLAGETSEDNAELAGIVDAVTDAWNSLITANFLQKTKELKEERCKEVYGIYLPSLCTQINSIIEKNGHEKGWIWGQKLTYADLAIYHLLSHLVTTDEKVLSRYPHLSLLYTTVEEQPRIAQWIKQRPQDLI